MQEESCLPSTVSLLKCCMYHLELDKVKTRGPRHPSRFQEPEHLNFPLLPILAHYQGAESAVEQLGFQPVLRYGMLTLQEVA